jgi:hypothetical protein
MVTIPVLASVASRYGLQVRVPVELILPSTCSTVDWSMRRLVIFLRLGSVLWVMPAWAASTETTRTRLLAAY